MAVGRGLAVVMAAMVCLQAASAQVCRSRLKRPSPAAMSDRLDVVVYSYCSCSAFYNPCTMLYFQTTSKRQSVQGRSQYIQAPAQCLRPTFSPLLGTPYAY